MPTDAYEHLRAEIHKLREVGEALVERVEDVAASIRYMTNNLLDDQYHPELAGAVRDLACQVNGLISLSPAATEHEALPPYTRRIEEAAESAEALVIAEQTDDEASASPPVADDERSPRQPELLATFHGLADELAECEACGEEVAWQWWEANFEEVRALWAEYQAVCERTHGKPSVVSGDDHEGKRFPPQFLPEHWPAEFVAAYDDADADAEEDASERGRGAVVEAERRERQQGLFDRGEDLDEAGVEAPEPAGLRESRGQGGMDSLAPLDAEHNHRPYTFDDFRQFLQRRDALAAEEWKQEYAWLRRSEKGFVETLLLHHGAPALQQLALRCGVFDARRQPKRENAQAIYRASLRQFVLDGTISYNPHAESVEEVIDRRVAALSDEDFARHRAEREARDSARRKAIENPETLAEFHTFVRELGEERLSDQQHLRRDRLYADLSRQTRRERTAKTVAQFQAAALDGLTFTIREGYHEKRACPLWIVQPSARVDRASYGELKAKAAQLGGWYSSFKKDQAGFQFLSRESAEKFAGLHAGDADRSEELADRRIRQLENVAERFAEMAARLRETATAALEADDGKLKNTARRAEQAASMRARAREDLATAATLQSLAARLQEGSATYLDGVRYAVQIETLRSLLRRARWTHVRHVLASEQADRSTHERNLKQDELERRPLDLADVRHAVYPKPYLYRGHLERALAQLRSTKGVQQAAAKITKLLARAPAAQEFVEFASESDVAVLEDFLGRAQGAGYNCYWFEHCLDDYKRLRAAQIHDGHELRAALAELVPHLAPAGQDDPITQAVEGLRGRDLPGFFPTPRPIIRRMLELAAIQGDDRVLEPSAGMGDILDAIRAEHPSVDIQAVERNHALADVLAAKGYGDLTTFGDFLEHYGPYDVIVMNPPFENGAEIEHVRHAYDLLACGGRLVSVMSKGPYFRGDQRAREFRAWLDDLPHDLEELPEDAFRGVEAFRETSVRTCLVLLTKPTT